MVKKAYEKFIEDETILSLLQLAKIFGIVKENASGGRAYQKFCKQLYESYGKNNVKKITASRRASNAAKKQWKTRSRTMPDSIKEKIRQSNLESWSNDDGTRRKLSKHSMIKNALPVSKKQWVREKAIETRKNNDNWANYTQDGYESLINKLKNRKFTDKSLKKMSTSAIKRGNNLPEGFQHTKHTKKLLSDITKKQWEDGIHKPIFKSKGQSEIVDFLKENNYIVEEEYIVEGRPFDFKVNDLLVEFNGTYWHLDPRLYERDYYDKSRQVLAEDIWKRDNDKKNIAIKNGYRFLTIWQKDFEENKNETLKNLIKTI